MKIEQGCRAVIINSHAGNDGIIVTVGNRIDISQINDGLNWTTRDGVRWEIDVGLQSNFGEIVYHVGEKQLKRIDDEDPNTKISWESMSDLWVPDEIKTDTTEKMLLNLININ